MGAIHSQFQQYNPIRVPSWRADYIDKLLSHQPRPQRPSRTRDDEWVKRGWKFLRQWYSYGVTPQDHENRINELYPLNPGLFYASMLYGNEDSETRTMLEANLLARLTDERIAQKMGTLKEMSYRYERIYFDIRERLDDWHYISKVIAGRATDRAVNREGSITAFQKALVIKTFAYYGGEHMLNMVMTGFASNLTAPRRSQDAKQWAEEMFNAGLARQGLIATTVFDTNKFNIISMLQLTQSMVQQEQHVRMFGSTSLEIDRNIEKAAQLIQIQMAGSSELLTPSANGKRSGKRVSELRSAEQLQLAAGRKLSSTHETDEAELRERMAHPNVTRSHEG